jgi:AAA+ superfamily predicted ATPase
MNEFIAKLKIMLKFNDVKIKKIANINLLISSLEELDSLIGMDEIKIDIVKQIKFFIMVGENNNHMFHTIIFGNPGTGKTTVSKILAKIWLSLGLIKSKNRIKLVETENSKIRESFSEILALATDAYELFDDIAGNKRKIKRFYKDLYDSVVAFKPYPEIKFIEEINFVIADASDLIAEYVGQTSPKTKAVLERARGGVLFVDEAYSIAESKYGYECINVINEYMSLYSSEIIIIFSGYKDKLNNFFNIQPGLRRRFTFNYEIQNYNLNSIVEIFKLQMSKNGWKIDNTINLVDEIKEIYRDDLNGGIEKLVLYCKFIYSEDKFDEIGIDDENKIITKPMLQRAIVNFYNDIPKDDNQIFHFYI